MRKQLVDQQRLVGLREDLVEQLRLLERVSASKTEAPCQLRADFGPCNPAAEVERRPDRLFDDSGDEQLRPAPEQPRLAERADDAELVETGVALGLLAVCTGSLSVCRTSVERRLTRVKRFTDRFEPQRLRRPISNSPARRQVEVIFSRAARAGRTRAQRRLDAAAVAERGAVRFLDGE